MSGTVKKVAEAAAKADRTIDWDGMAKMLVSEEARKEFAPLRRTFEDVNHQLQTEFSQAGQVYGVPLSGSLLIKSGVYPE